MQKTKKSKFMIASGLAISMLVASGIACAEDDSMDGKKLYQGNCASCHGMNGEPTEMGKSLKPFAARNHRAIAQYVSRDELRRIITYGVKGTAMEAKKYTLDPLQIDAVIDFIKTFEYEPDLANGKARFEAVCVQCHGVDGRAQTGVGAKNLIYTKLGLEEIVHTMRYGRPGTLMDSKRHQLSNPDIADVANYVYSLRYNADHKKGKILFKENCQSCHSTAKGIKLISNAASSQTLSEIDDHTLDLRIRHGRHVHKAGKHVNKLSSDEIQDIIAYIRDELK